MARRLWTEEEVTYLEDNWGVISLKTIAKNLNRSINAVKLKGGKIGLSDARLSYEGITIRQLALALGTDYNVLANWVKVHGLPAKSKLFCEKQKVLVIKYDDFWKWAETNKQMIDFSKVEKNILGSEPDWVQGKRNADIIKKQKIKKSNADVWTEEEVNILKGMLKTYSYTYPEIADRLKRSQGSIRTKIRKLGLKLRPARRDNHKRYTQEEVELILYLVDKGHCLEDIASRIDKSSLGVRGKMERMGYKFKNGVPYKEIV